MRAPLTDFAKLGLGLNSLFPCKHDPEMHVEALTRIVDRGMLSLEIVPFPGRTVEETIEDNLQRLHRAWGEV